MKKNHLLAQVCLVLVFLCSNQMALATGYGNPPRGRDGSILMPTAKDKEQIMNELLRSGGVNYGTLSDQQKKDINAETELFFTNVIKVFSDAKLDQKQKDATILDLRKKMVESYSRITGTSINDPISKNESSKSSPSIQMPTAKEKEQMVTELLRSGGVNYGTLSDQQKKDINAETELFFTNAIKVFSDAKLDRKQKDATILDLRKKMVESYSRITGTKLNIK